MYGSRQHGRVVSSRSRVRTLSNLVLMSPRALPAMQGSVHLRGTRHKAPLLLDPETAARTQINAQQLPELTPARIDLIATST